MQRLFEEHLIRPVEPLDGQWEFVAEPQVTARDAAGLPTEFPAVRYVPGCWESHPEHRAYRGKGWYRMPLETPEAGPMRLVFKGVSHTARVFLDREEVGGHYNAYTAFEVVLAHVEAGEHELLVEVDNTFGPHSGLHVENDYYTYGGITRPVAAEMVPAQYLRMLHVTPRRGEGGRWEATVRVQVRNLTQDDAPVRVLVEGPGATIELGETTVDAGGTVWLEAEVTFDDVDPWTPETPELYYVQALLFVREDEEPVDDLVDRIGFREVTVEGTEILLNGEPLKVCGLNRHEDHPLFGCAFPLEALVQDIERLEHLGANLDRTCHYPNDERWLDLCDERGILVWEENHARGLTGDAFRHPKFREQCHAVTREMVEQHLNHPSIILWGVMNECESFSDLGRELYGEQLALIKELDPSRPTTFASCHMPRDVCLDLPDVVSYNIYTGWYRDSRDDIPQRTTELIAWIEGAGGKGKPILISEFGGGAIPGYHSETRCKWTEGRQADILDACLAHYLHHPRLAGGIIWQYCDCRVTEGRSTSRPRTMNNKGVVDEFRRPKLSYPVVRRHFHEALGRPLEDK